MSTFLLRDDDANATTDPEVLARVYAPLLDAGHRLAFATIPEVALDTLAPDGRREAFLSPAWPASAAHARMHRDTPLAVWLRAHAHEVDVLQHGLSHARVRAGTELGALGLEEARARIDLGKRILTGALDDVPAGFVAPWDKLSRDAMDAAMRAYDFVSTSWVAPGALPRRALLAHVRERLAGSMVLRAGRCLIARHRGGFLGAQTRPEDVPALLRVASQAPRGGAVALTVVNLHHWMFFGDAARPEPHPVVRALARALPAGSCARVADVIAGRRAA